MTPVGWRPLLEFTPASVVDGKRHRTKANRCPKKDTTTTKRRRKAQFVGG
jgi:hypothetical protein